MNKKVALLAAFAAIILLGGCTAPSGRPGQASPTPTPSVTTPAPSAPATSATPTQSATPAPTVTTPAAATPTPAPTLAPALVNNWPALLASHPEVVTDLLKAGWTVEQVAAQAAIRTSAGKTPIATVKVAFGNTTGGDLISAGGCKTSGTCPSGEVVEGLLPLVKTEGEPLKDPSRGVLVVFTADSTPVVLHDLTLKKR